MKRILTVAIVLGFMATGFAQASNTVSSVNIVGYNTVQLGAGDKIMVGLPWNQVQDVGVAVSELLGTNLPHNTDVAVWNRTNKIFQSSTWKDDRGGARWENDQTIYRGDAFWVANGSGVNPIELTFSGEVPTAYSGAGTTTVSIVGLDMVVYSYPTDIMFTNTELHSIATNHNDSVSFWDTTTGWQQYVYKDDRGGQRWEPTVDSLKVDMGEAFWFDPAINTITNFWTETVPYDL